jgi:hypothetical protein
LDITDRLRQVGERLIDQQRARVIVPPQRASTGHWFGGGNMVQDENETLWLVGRYRNQGDSRTGLGGGERGLELAVFRSSDGGATFEKAISFSKADLNVDSRDVLSIEGSALRLTKSGVELYVSTEKSGIGYPDSLESFLKPGTGVWTIDRLQAESIDKLADAPLETILESNDPRFVHIKDPFLGTHGGKDSLMFCTHPYCWTSSNTGFVSLEHQPPSVAQADLSFFARGYTWDVAITRGTAVLPLPSVGVLADRDVKLLFYDGGECVRNLDEHASAVKRPRGYSCEELGGLAYYQDDDLRRIERISIAGPMFVSPHGSGCSRYVDVLATRDHFHATWQQAQPDGSQPLVINTISRVDVEEILK